MILRKWILAGALFSTVLFSACYSRAQTVALLDVSQGQLPSDTGSDGATTFALENQKELGGRALKIIFAPGDSAGDRIAKVTNWKQFDVLKFSAFNPGTENVNLIFTVRHKGSTNVKTRVDVPVYLKSGRNDIKINIDSMVNGNGSAPDLTNVVRWYIATEPGKQATIYLSDILLVADKEPTVVRSSTLMTGSNGAHTQTAALLDVSQGQLPSDTGSDGATKFALESQKELGGRALKIVYAPGDSAGDRIAKVTNWKQFDALKFAAFNPGSENVNLIFTVRHKSSTNVKTRVDVPVSLKPGRNDIKINIDTMVNGDGSAPDLANVVKWYLACEPDKAPTIYISDILLVANKEPAVVKEQAVVRPASPTPATGGAYRITGKIGEMVVDMTVANPVRGKFGEQAVDITITPIDGIATSSTPAKKTVTDPARDGLAASSTPIKKTLTDPARLERIRTTKIAAVTRPVMFDTVEADAIGSALEVFPPDNPWNQLVTDWPVHPNSKVMVASVGDDKPLRYNSDMAYVLVPPTQVKVNVKIDGYQNESDKGPFPVPDNLPIEGWPASFKRDPQLSTLTLEDVQQNKRNENSDRHAIVVDPVNRMLYEFYQMVKTPAGWQCAQASIFDLKSNTLRPLGWTSTDAAGLPLFPAMVRYDELKRGSIDHALRVTVRNTRRDFVAPATHYASKLTDENLPRMGERFRLRQNFDVAGFSPEVRVILTALKRYGMIVADNGIEWAISVAPDERIPLMSEELRKIKGSDFEVVAAP